MTSDPWLEAHSYLRPVADLSAEVDLASSAIEMLDARIPDWEDYRADYLAGVPLLSSADAGVDLERGGRMAAALIERLAAGTSSEWLAAEARVLDTALRRERQPSGRIADFLQGDETFTPPSPGLLRYLAWTAMRRFLRPVLSGFDACRQIQKQPTKTRVLVLTSFVNDSIIFEATAAGADGYLLKEINGDALVRAIETVAAGQSILDPSITRRVLGLIQPNTEAVAGGKLAILSAQEKRVLALVAEGKTNKEIAADLGLSDKTVKNYFSNVLDKLQLTRRTQAAVFFIQQTMK
jgi:DNA-binding NarL/FixJ family response regulator